MMRELAHLIRVVLASFAREDASVSPRWGEGMGGQFVTQGCARGLWNLTPLGSGAADQSASKPDTVSGFDAHLCWDYTCHGYT